MGVGLRWWWVGIVPLFGACAPDGPVEVEPAPVDPVPTLVTTGPEVPRSVSEANRAWCWVGLNTGLVVVGLDDGVIHETGQTVVGNDDLAYWNGSFYGVVRQNQVVNRYRPEPEEVVLDDQPRGISTYEGRLAVLMPGALEVFDDEQTFEDGDGTGFPWLGQLSMVSRIAIEGDQVYTAGSIRDLLTVRSVYDGSEVGELRLDMEGFGAIGGLDVVHDRLVVASSNGRFLRQFDLDGNLLDHTNLGGRPGGIWCDERTE